MLTIAKSLLTIVLVGSIGVVATAQSGQIAGGVGVGLFLLGWLNGIVDSDLQGGVIR